MSMSKIKILSGFLFARIRSNVDLSNHYDDFTTSADNENTVNQSYCNIAMDTDLDCDRESIEALGDYYTEWSE